jgi:integrase
MSESTESKNGPTASARASVETCIARLERQTQQTFPSSASAAAGARPISDNTINAALRGMGFAKGQMTCHGFRTMASTTLNELGVNSALIELQLAHTEGNKTRAAYNRSHRLPERRRMMQRFADHLDKLRASKQIKKAPRYGAVNPVHAAGRYCISAGPL